MTEQVDPATALMSGDPAEVRAGLADLDRRWRERREIAMAPPGPEVLDAFDPRAPNDVVMDYLSAMSSYRSFTPRLSAADLADLWVRTQLRHGDSATALQIALRSRSASDSALRPDALVELLAPQMPQLDDGVSAAVALVRHLLDSDLSHRETFAALSKPANRVRLSRVIREVAPWLDPDERVALRT